MIRSLLEDGPATAPELAERLEMTAAGIRRHLDILTADGIVESGERPAFGPAPTRGRGRPPRIYSISEIGRDLFEQSYDDLAVSLLRFLRESAGDEAVTKFADQRAEEMERRYLPMLDSATDIPARARALANALAGDGYAASVSQSQLVADGPETLQICQHNCPVAHVAAEFPQLCEAEAVAFSRLLGVNVTRLATIAHGDGICTAAVAASEPSSGKPVERISL